VPATLRQAAVLLEAACKLNPNEPRFPDLLTEAYLQLGGENGRAGAMSALERYLAVRSDDQAAQVRFIDMQLARMEAADQQIKYVDQLLKTEKIPAEVRSHVAVVGSRLAAERSESEHSAQLLEQALQLNPLNLDAIRLKYQRLGADATPAQRVALLVAMIRANPVQPGVMTELAAQLADVGQVDQALSWFTTGFSLGQRLGIPPNFSHFTAYAAELVVADQLKAAETLVQKLLEQDATNTDLAFLQLLIAKRGGDEERIGKSIEDVRTAARTRLSRISDLIHQRNQGQPPDAAASTQPNTNVDIPADLAKLQELSDADATLSYAAGLADLAWLEIYFNGKPADAQQYLAPLRQLLGDDNVTLTRLEGWTYLVDGKPDEARVKLSAGADRDPLARLGVLLLDSKDPNATPDALTTGARSLLADHASGLIGALLIEALRSHVGLMPAAPAAADVRAELERLPKDWLDILDFQKVKSFYALKAEPKKVGHSYGEPILADITITNTSTHDLTVGAEGVIRQDLWIDVQVKGVAQQHIPGVAFERIGQRLVLKPKQSITKTVRVDQGGLAVLLTRNPQVEMPLYFSILTNPLAQASGIAPGPAGQRQQFLRVVARRGSPLNPQALQAMTKQLLNEAADVRVRVLELMGTYAGMLRQQENPQMKGMGVELTDLIRNRTGDPVPAVRAAAMFVTAVLSDAAIREGLLRQMIANDSPFQVRVLGLLGLQSLEVEKRKQIAQAVATSDGDEIVKRLAESVIEVADLPPPATQPAEEQKDQTTTAGGK
jgi:hypothetical protein